MLIILKHVWPGELKKSTGLIVPPERIQSHLGCLAELRSIGEIFDEMKPPVLARLKALPLLLRSILVGCTTHKGFTLPEYTLKQVHFCLFFSFGFNIAKKVANLY